MDNNRQDDQNVNTENNDDDTPLHCVAQPSYENTELIKSVIDHNDDVNTKGSNNNTLLLLPLKTFNAENNNHVIRKRKQSNEIVTNPAKCVNNSTNDDQAVLKKKFKLEDPQIVNCDINQQDIERIIHLYQTKCKSINTKTIGTAKLKLRKTVIQAITKHLGINIDIEKIENIKDTQFKQKIFEALSNSKREIPKNTTDISDTDSDDASYKTDDSIINDDEEYKILLIKNIRHAEKQLDRPINKVLLEIDDVSSKHILSTIRLYGIMNLGIDLEPNVEDNTIKQVLIKRHTNSSKKQDNHTIPVSSLLKSLENNLKNKTITKDMVQNLLHQYGAYLHEKEFNLDKSLRGKSSSGANSAFDSIKMIISDLNTKTCDAQLVIIEKYIIPFIFYYWNARLEATFEACKSFSQHGKEGRLICTLNKRFEGINTQLQEGQISDLEGFKTQIQEILKQYYKCIDLPNDITYNRFHVIIGDARRLLTIWFSILENTDQTLGLNSFLDAQQENDYKLFKQGCLDRKTLSEHIINVHDESKLDNELKNCLKKELHEYIEHKKNLTSDVHGDIKEATISDTDYIASETSIVISSAVTDNTSSQESDESILQSQPKVIIRYRVPSPSNDTNQYALLDYNSILQLLQIGQSIGIYDPVWEEHESKLLNDSALKLHDMHDILTSITHRYSYKIFRNKNKIYLDSNYTLWNKKLQNLLNNENNVQHQDAYESMVMTMSIIMQLHSKTPHPNNIKILSILVLPVLKHQELKLHHMHDILNGIVGRQDLKLYDFDIYNNNFLLWTQQLIKLLSVNYQLIFDEQNMQLFQCLSTEYTQLKTREKEYLNHKLYDELYDIVHNTIYNIAYSPDNIIYNALSDLTNCTIFHKLIPHNTDRTQDYIILLLQCYCKISSTGERQPFIPTSDCLNMFQTLEENILEYYKHNKDALDPSNVVELCYGLLYDHFSHHSPLLNFAIELIHNSIQECKLNINDTLSLISYLPNSLQSNIDPDGQILHSLYEYLFSQCENKDLSQNDYTILCHYYNCRDAAMQDMCKEAISISNDSEQKNLAMTLLGNIQVDDC